MPKKFTKLFTPGKIGKLEIKNRLVMSPMGVHMADKDGYITDQYVDFLVERAKGGIGMVIVEGSYTQPYSYAPVLWDDKYIPGLKRLVDSVHQAGSKIAIQIMSSRGRGDLSNPVAPSDVPSPWTGKRTKVLTIEEIQRLVKEFGEAADRAKKACFDLIEVHCANHWMLADFFSPLINKRTDRYGGSPENRARLAIEMIQATRAVVGDDYPVTIRINADNRIKGGFSIKDAIPTCQMLERAGVDAISVTSGGMEGFEWSVPYMSMPHALNADLSEAIKKAVHIPVIVAGRINTPQIAEEILDKGEADFIALGRALIADPQFARKALEGRPEDICKCIACLRCQEGSGLTLLFSANPQVNAVPAPMRCTVNPAVGREPEFEIKPATKRKNVLVIGGGPAGMEAARVAALRGHKVTLQEASQALGGQMNLACLPPHKEEIKDVVDYLSIQLKKAGVKVELGKEATPQSVRDALPDVVIVAEGSVPLIPEISGIEQAIKRGEVFNSWEVLSDKARLGRRVVVLGGGLVGCEMAEFLANRGKEVTIIEQLEQLAAEAALRVKSYINTMLKEKRIRAITKAIVNQIVEKGLIITDKDSNQTRIDMDSVVLAVGSVPRQELYNALLGTVPELYRVGDCAQPRRIGEAMEEGSVIGLKL